MKTFDTHISHDGGTEPVEARTNGDGTVTISFGASYTLRVDESNIDKLRELLFTASRELSVERSVKEDADAASDEELVAVQEILDVWADELSDYREEIDQNEKSKKQAGSTSDGSPSPGEPWYPDDPVNW